MRWYKDMYIGESVGRDAKYYKYLIHYTKKPTGVYCLMPAAGQDDLIDICRSELLRVPAYYPEDQLVIGLAGSRAEACLLAGNIILDILKKTGGTDVRSFFGV